MPAVEVKIDTWEYGTVAEILHKAPYSEEGPTIAGTPEEEYITSPDAKVPKTLIRYPVRKKS